MPQPETSRLAHEKVKSEGKDKIHQQIIYDALLNRPNRVGTCSDIAINCNLDYYQVGKRISELLADGRIEIASEKGGRRGNRACRIYRALTDQPLIEIKPTNEAIEFNLFKKQS